MSTLPSALTSKQLPPAYDSAHLATQLEDVLSEVSDVVAPVWPLKDYVAVNPYAGMSHRSFMEAREFLRVFSDCETLMPLEYYAAEFHRGRFELRDIESAIVELEAIGFSQALTASQIAQNLMALGPVRVSVNPPAVSPNPDRTLHTIAEYATLPNDLNWTEAIVDEISKHCAAHYDQSQAKWSSPYAHLSLYQAWRSVAEHDFNIEILGLSGFRKFVAGLPHTPEAAIVYALQQLDVPQSLWSAFLLCQAFSVPGWCAWAKYQTSWTGNPSIEKNDLTCLLAIRLAYDAALARSKSLSVNWKSLLENESISFKVPRGSEGGDAFLRTILLRASEIAYRNELLQSLNLQDSSTTVAADDRKLAQLVFCIDVRSERMRRQLEAQSSDIETLGFAGFFGMAFEYASLGEASVRSQLPVLLQPQFKVHEGLRDANSLREAAAVAVSRQSRTWTRLWSSLQTSSVSCFSFVESAGLFAGFQLLRRLWERSLPSRAARGERSSACQNHLGPTLRGLCQQGITTSRQVEMAEGMLRNLGLVKNFARLIVFCGHAAQTDNNPLAASLDCGACGGHSGAPNARFAALLLNQPYIRQALAERGISIPNDSHFMAAVHITTTDRIEFFDVDDVPFHLHAELQELQSSCASATVRTQAERLPVLNSHSLSQLLGRSTDWSEVRPEWGLAGNAAFIVAPRSVTQHANLSARSFLHSYNYTLDPDGKVLETIMTAPMIVAHWINMQYYASTVDHHHFGSGNKTVHNVVGGFGILSGNSGDLQTGLPWQSLHNGQRYQHHPLRLQVIIHAPRTMIDRVIAKHDLVSNLLTGGWLHLIAIEEQTAFRLNQSADWEPINIEPELGVDGAR